MDIKSYEPLKPIFSALPVKKLRIRLSWFKRVLFYNPAEIYERTPVDVYRRIQNQLEFSILFPSKKDKTCACGCGGPLQGRRTRWATNECSRFAAEVWRIIDGQTAPIHAYLRRYYGNACATCGTARNLKVDHIIPVKHGGGGSWLNNFQLLCHQCHVLKTNNDFGWKLNKAKLKPDCCLPFKK